MQTFDVFSFQITPADDSSREIVMALLAAAGFDSFQETDDGCEAYIPQGQMTQEEMNRLIDEFQLPDITLSYSIYTLEQRDWNEQWEQEGFEPIVIDGLCSIHKPGQQVAAQPFDILINPRMAFGSGTHETTSQLVEKLLRQNLTGKRCLDMGCGTGILAICMAKAGAAQITAIDIDEFSVENTRENLRLNNITNVEVVHGDATAINGQYDLIVANIHRNIIIADAPTYMQHITSEGTLLVSGFYKEDMAQVVGHLEQCGLTFCGGETRNGWAVAIFCP
ncbi:MAG: 50S ribosomal protein L11 methyltransferase [Bacteroidales bacterium]|nr:50S ribosomal protein L11 methyltransferase [Bacteroidales bacterium]